MKVLILYFSGVGSTKKIAEMMGSSLFEHEVEVCSVEEKGVKDFLSYDALIVGTPTHHVGPAKFLLDYIADIPVQVVQIPTFVYNTKGLASCHTNRILAQKLLAKNLITIYEADYIAPASDGSLIIPSFKRFFLFEKDIEAKVANDCRQFLELVASQTGNLVAKLPPKRISSVINAPNKFGSQFVKLTIHLHEDACKKCDLCIKNCPYKAINNGKKGYPVIKKEKCTNCYRCIHHCKARALGLWKKKKHLKVLQINRI